MENGKLKDFTEMSIRVKDGKVEVRFVGLFAMVLVKLGKT